MYRNNLHSYFSPDNFSSVHRAGVETVMEKMGWVAASSSVLRSNVTAKPHLFRFSLVDPKRAWVCVGGGHVTCGRSPLDAHTRWLDRV